MKRSARGSLLLAACAAVSTLGVAERAVADTFTWNNTATPRGVTAPDSGDTWNVASNWDSTGGGIPGATDIAELPAYGSITGFGPQINLSTSVGGIVVDNSGADYTLGYGAAAGTNPLSIGADGITAAGGGTFTIQPQMAIVADQTWDIDAGMTLTYTRAMVTSTGNITVTGGGIVLGVLQTSARTGQTIVEGNSTIRTGWDNAFGTGKVTVNSTGTLELNNGANVTAWDLQMNDGATIRGMSGSLYNRTLLDLPSGASITLESLTAAGNSLTFGSNSNLRGGSAASVIKINAGRVNLAGNGTGTYLGSFRVESGATLALNTPTASVSRPITMHGGTLLLAGGTNASYSFGSVVSIADNVTATVSPDRTSSSSLTDRIIGGLVLGSGSKVIAQLGSNVTSVTASGAPWYTGTPLKVNTLTLNGDAAIEVAGSTMSLGTTSISGSGFGFDKLGTGRLHVNGTSNYSGATTVSAGEIFLGANGALGLGSTSQLLIKSAGQVRFNKAGTDSDTWTATGGISGDGILRLGNTGAGMVTISGQKQINPAGDTAGTAGKLDFQTKLTAALSGSDAPDLVIDIVGGGGVAGTDYDQLAIAQSLTGLNNIDLIVNFSTGLNQGDFNAAVLPILTFTSATGAAFNSVTINGGSASVQYNLTNVELHSIAVPEPSTLTLLGLTGLGLMRRRRRA